MTDQLSNKFENCEQITAAVCKLFYSPKNNKYFEQLK